MKLAVKVKFVAERFTSDLNDPDSSLFKNLTAKIEREVWRNSVVNFKSKKKKLNILEFLRVRSPLLSLSNCSDSKSLVSKIAGLTYPVTARRHFDVYTTSITLKRCHMDVKTTLCAYWVVVTIIRSSSFIERHFIITKCLTTP